MSTKSGSLLTRINWNRPFVTSLRSTISIFSEVEYKILFTEIVVTRCNASRMYQSMNTGSIFFPMTFILKRLCKMLSFTKLLILFTSCPDNETSASMNVVCTMVISYAKMFHVLCSAPINATTYIGLLQRTSKTTS